jgi:precorrin-6B methylase 2
MRRSPWARLALFGAWLAFVSFASLAQGAQPEADFEPYVGQDGKDVVWVPTPQALVDRMLNIAKLQADDYLIDLGSGDGRTVITAAKRGARALGIEYNPDMVKLANSNARKAGVADKAEFRRADLFQTDLSEATVITMFLLPEINMTLRPKLLKLKPGTRIVSNSFKMENWKPDATTTARKDCESYCTAYLWIIPAKISGTWNTPQGTLTLKQRFQYFTGKMQGSEPAVVAHGKLNGDHISFMAGHTKYEGRVNGNTIEGTASSQGSTTKWIATKS